MILPQRQQAVYDFLRFRTWTRPKDISIAVWGPKFNTNASSTVCKELVLKGLLERNIKGQYRRINNEN